jgi:uncharacterized protein (DUF885 family)
MSPEQIHETGKREVERILTEMAAIRKEMGFTGTADEFNDKVLNAPEMRFKTEAEIVAHGREIAKRIDPELPRLFKTLPRMTMAFARSRPTAPGPLPVLRAASPRRNPRGQLLPPDGGP